MSFFDETRGGAIRATGPQDHTNVTKLRRKHLSTKFNLQFHIAHRRRSAKK